MELPKITQRGRDEEQHFVFEHPNGWTFSMNKLGACYLRPPWSKRKVSTTVERAEGMFMIDLNVKGHVEGIEILLPGDVQVASFGAGEEDAI